MKWMKFSKKDEDGKDVVEYVNLDQIAYLYADAEGTCLVQPDGSLLGPYVESVSSITGLPS